MYQHLRSNGYYIEVLGQPYTCFDAKQYGTLLIVDPEEEFYREEIEKLFLDFQNGLSLIIFADWYNVTVMRKVKFFDENTRQWWLPVTGGTNIPALNELLSPWGIALGDQVFEGSFKVGSHDMYYASGTSIVDFPLQNTTGSLLRLNLNDQGHELLHGKKVQISNVPILGLYGAQNSSPDRSSSVSAAKNATGQLAIYGDSNCLDSAHLQKDCFWMLDALLQFTTTGQTPSFMGNAGGGGGTERQHLNTSQLKPSPQKPQRMEGNQLFKYSKVINEQLKRKPLPACLTMHLQTAIPLNTTAPDNLFKSQKLLSVDIDPRLFDAPLMPPNSGETANGDETVNKEANNEETFEHYDELSWSNSRLSNLFSGSKFLRVRYESETVFSLYTLLTLLVIILVVLYLLRHRLVCSSRGRRRRPRTTLYRLLRQGPLRTPELWSRFIVIFCWILTQTNFFLINSGRLRRHSFLLFLSLSLSSLSPDPP